jgi:hypothetical protein
MVHLVVMTLVAATTRVLTHLHHHQIQSIAQSVMFSLPRDGDIRSAHQIASVVIFTVISATWRAPPMGGPLVVPKPYARSRIAIHAIAICFTQENQIERYGGALTPLQYRNH